MNEFEPKFENGKEQRIDADFEKLKEQVEKKHEKAAEQALEQQESKEVLRERVEKAAKDNEKVKSDRRETPARETAVHTSTKLKNHELNQTIRRTQKKLPARERAFSKVIHQPAVEAASDIGGATVARPSGLLFGGLFSVISSLAFLYISKHYGYEYNFLIGIVFFIGGFALGIFAEGLFKLVKR